MGNDGLVMVIATLWFMFISKHWKTLFLTATIISYICFIIMCTMPESPKFLVGSGKYDEARIVMSRIAKYNGIQELLISSDDKNKNFQTISSETTILYPFKWTEEVAKE